MDKFSDDILSKVFSYFPMKRWNCILLTCKRFNDIGKKVFDPSIKHDRALMSAVTRKNFKLVSYLLKDPRVNPSSFHDVTIRSACKEGQTEIVKQLLKDKRVNPCCDGNSPIILASSFGHSNIVQILLDDERVDPSVYDNIALKWSSRLGHSGVVKELLKDNRVLVDEDILREVSSNLKKVGKLDDSVQTLISVRSWNLQ